ncbi:MAG TPA: hypothetical protein VMV94_19645 [Phycisphaerae bacterium]|nr:hypothetical protein [Phycisphaerae bacterium]
MKHLYQSLLTGMLLCIPAGAYAFAPGDLNCDGVVNDSDIGPFVLALTDPVAYGEAFPSCDVMLADTIGDGVVNGLDIDSFVQIVLGGGLSGVVSAQLAGNSLSQYPYFEYVKAFNQNAPIQLGLDPTRYPGIVGRTADVYVVEHKSAGLWQIDRSLNDVTGGGPQTVTFAGGGIQSNRFTITGPNELSAAVYDPGTGDFTGLGRPYDMVVDFNRDGWLDGGDYIDGFSNEAGLYVVHDTTQPGPLAVTDVTPYSVGAIHGIPASYTHEVLYYPTNIQSMTPRPLVVVGHGGGHNYLWYDHIGHHLASYGYIVMSHENCYGPPDCTLGHTDAILDLQDTIAGGAINGKIDSSRIIWIGHSLGGEGVTLAIDALIEGTYSPAYYSRSSIVLVSPMLPVVDPSAAIYDVNFHLWTASGDSDVSGAAGWDMADTFELHDRATKFRSSTIVQGAGHAWFHNGPPEPSYFEGPCSIGQANTHLIQLGLFLPLVKYYAEGNIPATDFLWRQYEHFHPIGVDTSNPCIVVTNEYRNGADQGNFMIDNYQTGEATDVSSSGGAVTFTVQNVFEGQLRDINTSFAWTDSDPFNGATQASAVDASRAVVFEWNGSNAYYEWEVVPAAKNFADYLYLSFRGAQGTQHPYTIAQLGDLTFTVTLRDGAGRSRSINIGAYGGGLEEPYQRQGGWHNEMEINRIRITDFLANGSGLDLTNIVAVRFNFGPSYGSNEGRIVIDELMLTNDRPPYFVPLTMSLAESAPEFIPPAVPTIIDVLINEGTDTLVPGSPRLYYSSNGGGTWITSQLRQVGADLWRGMLPAPACTDRPRYYFSAAGVSTGTVFAPASGPAAPFVSYVGVYSEVFADNFETDKGWTIVTDPGCSGGHWQRAVPIPCSTPRGDPPRDYDGSGRCFVTQNNLSATSCNTDVDGGWTRLISPTFSLADVQNPRLRFAYWWYNDDLDGDPYMVEVSNDGGASWAVIHTIVNLRGGWRVAEYELASYIPLTSTMKLRFSVADIPNNSIDEGALDAVVVFGVSCP